MDNLASIWAHKVHKICSGAPKKTTEIDSLIGFIHFCDGLKRTITKFCWLQGNR